MDHALYVADGDRTRLVPRPDGSVIVANHREQARRALRDLTFGAVTPLEEPTSPDEAAPKSIA